MTDNHSQSFFGQSTGLTLQSSSMNEPYIFLKCIKKKSDGSWEKPSLGEGKTIKCSLEEIVMVLKVLNKEKNEWKGFHDFKGNKTPISFSRENGNKQLIWINIGEYSKMLSEPQIEILRLLLKHLLKEKIKFATISNMSQKLKNKGQSTQFIKSDVNIQPEKIDLNSSSTNKTSSNNHNQNKNEKSKVGGVINGATNKALLIMFEDGQELWTPKSIIHSEYDEGKGNYQQYVIDDWFLQKNKLVANS